MTMTKTEFSLPPLAGLREHLVFVALLIPTFILLAAVAVSFARPDPMIGESTVVAACESCGCDNGECP